MNTAAPKKAPPRRICHGNTQENSPARRVPGGSPMRVILVPVRRNDNYLIYLRTSAVFRYLEIDKRQKEYHYDRQTVGFLGYG